MTRKAKILVVDDKRPNLLALEAVLGDEHDLLFAQSGKEAIALLQRQRDVDLVLLDVQMPDLDGFETAQLIKRLESCSDIPIIFVTAIYTEDPFIRKGYEVGGIDYFSKPFDPEVLKLKVAVYASFRRRESFLRERELHLREAEELLRAGRKLSAVLESLPVGVLIADEHGRICQATEQASRILNIAGASHSGAWGELLGWWDSAGKALRADGGPLSRALHKGEFTHGARLRVRQFDGRDKEVLASVAPLRTPEERIAGAVVLLQDAAGPQGIATELEQRVAKLVSLGLAIEESVSPAAG